MINHDDFNRAHGATQSVYDRHARVWHEGRTDSLYEQIWLDRFEARLAYKGHLLDLGCGSGKPLGGYFLSKGYSLTGLDYAPGMIELAAEHYPAGTWITGDMTSLQPTGPFTGIYSWDGFFHLKRADQRALLPKLCALLESGGALMLTVGYGDGEVLGTVAGEQVYHASLSEEEYRTILTKAGCTDIVCKANDQECLGRSLLLASKA